MVFKKNLFFGPPSMAIKVYYINSAQNKVLRY